MFSEADLRVGDATALPFPDESFDMVVITLSLCTIPDDQAAIAESSRVLRAGGRLLLLEHVRSPVLAVRVVQRVLDPLFVRFEEIIWFGSAWSTWRNMALGWSG